MQIKSQQQHTISNSGQEQSSFQQLAAVLLVFSHSVVSDSLQPHGLQPTRLLCPWNSPGKDTRVGSCPLLQGIFPIQGSNPGIKPRSSALQADSLPAEPPGKPKNTGVGSLSLLQGIFLTQGSNPDLPHDRQILYHLSHQGSPRRL